METTAELKKRFDDLFLQQFENIKEEDLKENVSFDQLGIDSMDKLEFQFELEKEFDVDLADDLDALRKPEDMFNNLIGALEKQ